MATSNSLISTKATAKSIATALLLAISLTAYGQQNVAQYDTITYSKVKPWAVRNNLLYDAALTPNIGFDYRLDSVWTIGFTAGYRPWPTDDMKEKKWRHFLIMPELRHWSDSVYADKSWFWGINMMYSHYNVSNVHFPFGLYPSVRHARKEGDLVAIGASYGRSWRLSRLFRLEAEAGVDVGYAWGDKYNCGKCGKKIGEYDGPFLVPKLALNIVLNPKTVHQVQLERPVEPTPPVIPGLAFGILPPATVSDILASKNPVLEEYANYRPYDRTRVLRKEKGMLWVHFPLDKTTLLYDFRDNAPILDNIVDITRQIMADSMSNVRLIQIIGLASVEGTVPHNEDLGNGRAQALRDYIKERVPGTTDQLFELNGGGEAWAELRDQINDVLAARDANAPLEGLQQVLTIMDTEQDLNRREQKIRRLNGGKTYDYIKDELLPDQRNSGYLRIYFDRVPDANADAINRAVRLMQQQRWQEALPILNNVREDKRSWNALGVTLFMTGQREQSLDYFRRAAANGNADARENADKVQRYLDALRTYQTEYEKYNQLIQSRTLAP